MTYEIVIFNQQPVVEIAKESFVEALNESNLFKLCEQYALDPAVIEPLLTNLEVVTVENEPSPFFILRYHPGGLRPIVVDYWDLSNVKGKAFLRDVIELVSTDWLIERLQETGFIIRLELIKSQLLDAGLLLAYELARWMADQGSGIVRGLDGNWYRLNRHKAFLKMKAD
jgi:hypothetical protein